uniref:Uncharacterized protein n=1 Tax=Trichogramma kaykai TaxID=54128 RepID=A0ABD2W4M0_9HYME
MSKILQSTYSDEREKCHNYQQVLQRYLQLKDTKKPLPEEEADNTVSDVADIIASDITAVSDTPVVPKSPVSFDSVVIESLPVKFKNNGKRLLKWLRQHSDISWSEKGVVTIDGSRIDGNMLDLVSAIMRPRKPAVLPGIEQFTTALRRASVPGEFIGNKQYQRFITEVKEESSAERVAPKRKRSENNLTVAETEDNTTSKRPQAISGYNSRKWLRYETPSP